MKINNKINKPLLAWALLAVFIVVTITAGAWVFTTPPNGLTNQTGMWFGNNSLDGKNITGDMFKAMGEFGVVIGSYVDSYSCDGSFCIYSPWYASGQYYAKNMTTGKIDYSGTNLVTILNNLNTPCNNVQRCTIVFASGLFTADTSSASISPLSRMRIRGQGKNVTTLKLADNSNKDLFNFTTFKEAIEISDMTIDGNRANNNAGELIHFMEGGWRNKLSNLIIINAPTVAVNHSGTSSSKQYEFIMDDVEISYSAGYGIFETNSYDEYYENVIIQHGGSIGYYSLNSGGADIFHLHSYNNSIGAQIYGSNSNNCFDCYMDTNQNSGLTLTSATKNQIIGGRFMDNGWAATDKSGISLSNSNNNTIMGALFNSESTLAPSPGYPTQYYGINEQGTSDNNTFIGNTFIRLNSSGVPLIIVGNNTYYAYNHGESRYGNKILTVKPTAPKNGSWFGNQSSHTLDWYDGVWYYANGTAR